MLTLPSNYPLPGSSPGPGNRSPTVDRQQKLISWGGREERGCGSRCHGNSCRCSCKERQGQGVRVAFLSLSESLKVREVTG